MNDFLAEKWLNCGVQCEMKKRLLGEKPLRRETAAANRSSKRRTQNEFYVHRKT
jgi:hypothetical protein